MCQRGASGLNLSPEPAPDRALLLPVKWRCVQVVGVCRCPGDPRPPPYLATGSAWRAWCNCRICRGLSLAAGGSSPRTADTCDLRRLSGQRESERKCGFAGASQSPLTDSNRRPPPYHEREEGVDSCGFARSGAGSRASLIAARCRVLHGRATLVRPQLSAATTPTAHDKS